MGQIGLASIIINTLIASQPDWFSNLYFFTIICVILFYYVFLVALDMDFKVSAVNLFYLGRLEGKNVILITRAVILLASTADLADLTSVWLVKQTKSDLNTIECPLVQKIGFGSSIPGAGQEDHGSRDKIGKKVLLFILLGTYMICVITLMRIYIRIANFSPSLAFKERAWKFLQE